MQDLPRRLTPTERLHEVTMAYARRQATPPEHGVELTRNAKGIAQFTVTARGYDLDEVLQTARDAYDTLVASYPYESEDLKAMRELHEQQKRKRVSSAA